jgi:hypothetical protein
VNDIVTWLGRQLDEREAIALAAQGTTRGIWKQVDPGRGPGRIEDDYGDVVTYDESSPDEAQGRHIAANDPASALRAVVAERAILALHWDGHGCPTCLIEMNADEDSDGNQHQYPVMHWTTPCPTTRWLAAPYDDRPGFDESWRIA